MEEIRKFKFTLDEAKTERGVVKLIGRASDTNSKRFARRDNLLFNEKSLSKNHAILGLKLLDPLETNVHIIDQFRIYVKDLGSTYGIVDLNSEECDPFVIDLKNGERFGLVSLEDPMSIYQCRAAKLKFQVNLQYSDAKRGILECIVRDVSFNDSSAVPGPIGYGEDAALNYHSKHRELSSSSSSSSDWNYSEEFSIIKDPSDQEEDAERLKNLESSTVSEEGYDMIDLLAMSQECIEWDLLEWDEVNHDPRHMRIPNNTLTTRNKCLIINCQANKSDQGSEVNTKTTEMAKLIIVSALVGSAVGLFATVALLAALAFKEME